MSKTTEPDPADTLVAQLRGSCGPLVMSGINGNIPGDWRAGDMTAARIPGTQKVSIWCNAYHATRGLSDGGVAGGLVHAIAGSPDADHLRIADALAESIRSAIHRREVSSGRAIRIALAPGAKMPERKTAGASGYDLCSLEDRSISPGEVVTIDTGVTLEMPEGTEAQIRPRSGLSSRGLIAILGTVDADFRSSVGVIMANLGQSARHVAVGDRIAQLVFARVELPTLRVVQVDELTKTDRGDGGLGSTGNR